MKSVFIFLTMICIIPSFSQAQSETKKINEFQKENERKTMHIIDSLRTELLSAGKKDKSAIEFILFREYFSINLDSADAFADRSVQSALLVGDSLGIVNGLNATGGILLNRGNPLKAIKCYEKAMGIARRNKFSNPVRYMLNNLANTHTDIGEYETALKYHFESLKIREASGPKGELSVTLNNIGWLYQQMGNYNDALKYYERSYKIKIDNDVLFDLTNLVINMASTLNCLGKYDEAKSRIDEMFQICDRSECESIVYIEGHLVLGESLFNLGMIDSARMNFDQSAVLSVDYKASKYNHNFLLLKCENYYWLSMVEFEKRHLKEAIKYLDLSQHIASESGFQKQIAKNDGLYSKIYYEQKDYKRSIDTHILFERINSKILNAEIVNRARATQFQYDMQAKEDKLLAQEKIVKLQEQRIQQQLIVNLLIGLVVLLLAGLMIILVLRIVKKQKINEMLDLRVRERTGELELSRDEFRHANDEKIYVLNKVSGDLAKSLASLKGLSALAVNDSPGTHATYFKELTALAEKMVDYVNQYIPDKVK